ncbi:hypothetical protein Q8A67_025063 [Cirrhinus molitorella]|uniref:Uncharacterized protein n=1 Tax=Cirrhinus molitorella TaxID=172907 RepID=A0AA88NYW4_9TELE|nr:hypothetical protein Q8A67_025063 [Cirrhinus molitorella]
MDSSDTQRLSELRIVLMGHRVAVSGDDGSDLCSLGSSAYGSFRSRSGDSFGSQSRDSYHTWSGAMKRHDSMNLLPPKLSGDERSDTMSDVVQSWYESSPSIVQNAEKLVANAEE